MKYLLWYILLTLNLIGLFLYFAFDGFQPVEIPATDLSYSDLQLHRTDNLYHFRYAPLRHELIDHGVTTPAAPNVSRSRDIHTLTYSPLTSQWSYDIRYTTDSIHVSLVDITFTTPHGRYRAQGSTFDFQPCDEATPTPPLP